MNKKGFTLIELLVVIVLIASITVASGIGITQMLEREKSKEYDRFVKKIEQAACSYAENETYKNEKINSVKIGTLIENGYLDRELVNPKTNQQINTNDNREKTVSVGWSNGLKTCTYNSN